MKLYAYRGADPNFGDELNHWMWPQLLPGFFDDDPATLFLGIGSILFDHHPPEPLKLVVGSGYGGYTKPPVLDARWRVHFVRGPRTAAALGLDPGLAVGDAAILLRALNLPSVPKRFAASFIPHWESAIYGAWQPAAEAAGLHYIDPRWPVERVLDEIMASELVITEAMHGAIVADALRVPWVAVRPLFESHVFKWSDWAEALDMSVSFQNVPPSSLLEALGVHAQSNKTTLRRIRHYGTAYKDLGAGLLRAPVVKALRRASAAAPQQSRDSAIERSTERMLETLAQLRADYPHTVAV